MTITDISKFQFHKGTIKTIPSLIINIITICYFNSIKVRLKLVGDGAGSWVMSSFQFHKGTIKTRCNF